MSGMVTKPWGHVSWGVVLGAYVREGGALVQGSNVLPSTIDTCGRFSILSDPMIEVIVVTHFYFNPTLTLTPLHAEETISACKIAEKVRDSNADF